MTIFTKCPICGEFAFVQPELGDKDNRAFKCDNGHEFKKKPTEKVNDEDAEILDQMPEWARVFKQA